MDSDADLKRNVASWKTCGFDIVEICATADKTLHSRFGIYVSAGAGFNDSRCLDWIRRATQMPLNDMTRMERGKKKRERF